ncbi:hypothetical protein GCM10027176_37370 [Actinoallomurus bryophytorum]|uniref:Uncharacterized protein n=1 Tax=Actinoallomurus bryophytorum TaxID=1490222 RepID=A0A543CIY6_9ACTN|nr:hypothetical protein [Actinoallomurus bryophytorum]TQL97058.1 hypothetical protein FB559_2632 [Actinoallomurus bryophytorum]
MRIVEDEQFIICFNPDAVERDAAIRTRMITQPEDAIAGSAQLSKDKRAELPGVISTKPGPNRYLREERDGRRSGRRARGRRRLEVGRRDCLTLLAVRAPKPREAERGNGSLCVFHSL